MDTTVAKRPDEGAARSGDNQLRIIIRIGHIYSICLLVLVLVSALLVFRNPTPVLGGLMQTFLCVGLVGSLAFTAVRQLSTRVLKLEDELHKLKQELVKIGQCPNDRNA
jgi:hypothetical protein